MAAPPAPSVYRTRAYVIRQRVLIGLAAAGLVLVGYLIGRWQDTPTVITLPTAVSGPPSASAEPAPSTEAPTPTNYPTLQAESATALDGIKIQRTDDEGGGDNVGFISDGDFLRFDNLDFGPVPATAADVRVASAADPEREGKMEIRLDNPDAAPVGTLRLTPTGGWQDWRTDEVTLKPITGVHTVFLMFLRNDDDEFANVNWLQFRH